MISQGLKKKKERESRASEIAENLIYNVTDRDTIRKSLNFNIMIIPPFYTNTINSKFKVNSSEISTWT